MYNKSTSRIALIIALGLATEIIESKIKPSPPIKQKTQGDFNKLTKAKEKRIRKINKRLKDISQ